ncbi:tail assembly chaperone [Lacticaseibacillus nasuensis]|uniref:Phage protein n=1 Tax=Lacticaseibacillus nasuensis JCM 17158 TaxID=1291734 RepID=A0A0R1JXE5_9LACO|nr:tail assembly chaperone [Lacticaseibacillus nasuensis]KRK73188.1 hypothetical protein FD02_GL001044 [Lacticaseibacillus nasuensis JCM 17158]
MLGIKIKGTDMPLKFNFAALYRANKLFSSEPGKDDGGTTIWLGFVTGETMVLFKAIKSMLPDNKFSDDDIIEAIDDLPDPDAFYEETVEELHKSAFFRREMKQWLKLTENYGKTYTDKKNMTDEEKVQKKGFEDMLAGVKKSLS